MQRRRLPPLDSSSRLSSTSIQSWNVNQGGKVISNRSNERRLYDCQTFKTTDENNYAQFRGRISESACLDHINQDQYLQKYHTEVTHMKSCDGNHCELDYEFLVDDTPDCEIDGMKVKGSLFHEYEVIKETVTRDEVLDSDPLSNNCNINYTENANYRIDDTNNNLKSDDDHISNDVQNEDPISDTKRNISSSKEGPIFDRESREKTSSESATEELSSKDEQIREQVKKTGVIITRIITWNHSAQLPTAHDVTNNLILRNHFHVIVFCSQECERSIARSFFIRSKAKWESIVSIAVGPDYAVLRTHTLQAIHSVIFVHRSILPLIHDIQAISVPTGIGGFIGNKGGIGISFKINNKSFCFVNAHLFPHVSGVTKRISEYQRISITLAKHADDNQQLGRRFFQNVIRKPRRNVNKVNPVSVDCTKSLTDKFDFVFWAGDLNFRTNGTRAIVDGLLKASLLEILLHNDQLSLLMKIDPLFCCLSEGKICFRPTYKFDKNSEVYDTSRKHRVPSWTDRILFKKESHVELISYRCANNLRHSDHRPVHATFRCYTATKM